MFLYIYIVLTLSSQTNIFLSSKLLLMMSLFSWTLLHEMSKSTNKIQIIFFHFPPKLVPAIKRITSGFIITKVLIANWIGCEVSLLGIWDECRLLEFELEQNSNHFFSFSTNILYGLRVVENCSLVSRVFRTDLLPYYTLTMPFLLCTECNHEIFNFVAFGSIRKLVFSSKRV